MTEGSAAKDDPHPFTDEAQALASEPQTAQARVVVWGEVGARSAPRS
jgi:hypothetical protein